VSGRILLGSRGIPELDARAARLYRLWGTLRGDGLDVGLMNLVEAWEAEYLLYRLGAIGGNPRQLPDVHTCVLDEPLLDPQPRLADAIEAQSPGLLLASDAVSALLMKRAVPARRLIFLGSAPSPAGDPTAPLLPSSPPALELEAVLAADLIVVCSGVACESMAARFPDCRSKLYCTDAVRRHESGRSAGAAGVEDDGSYRDLIDTLEIECPG